MPQIRNIEGLTTAKLNEELKKGGKFVIFQYTVSVIVVSLKRSSDIYFLRAGETSIKDSFSYTLIALFLGWWGISWGPIYTNGSLYTNFRGGKDVTQEVLNAMNS